MITPQELYAKVVAKLNIKEIHPLHVQMLEECCENAASNEQNVIDEDSLLMAVQVAFVTCNSALRALIKSMIENSDAEQATLNYRGHSFVIPNTSPFLIDEYNG